MSSVKTTFAKGINPFFDPANIKINSDALPPEKRKTFRASKYETTFRKMKEGNSLTVPNAYRRRVHEALKFWMITNKKKGIVRSFSHDPVGEQSTIYWLPEDWAK